jgi:hypothetical protein
MLIHGIGIVDEIREFNQRLSRAREMLSVSPFHFYSEAMVLLLRPLGTTRHQYSDGNRWNFATNPGDQGVTEITDCASLVV